LVIITALKKSKEGDLVSYFMTCKSHEPTMRKTQHCKKQNQHEIKSLNQHNTIYVICYMLLKTQFYPPWKKPKSYSFHKPV